MNSILRKIHRWAGFPLGIIFLVTFATGLLTAIDELSSRWSSSPVLIVEQYQEASLEQHAAALALLSERHKDIAQIVMPTKAAPYYQLRSREESVFYPITDLESGVRKARREGGFFETVLQLHRNLLLGKEGIFGLGGADYVAWVSLFSLLISLLGLWFWWPLRRSFKVKALVPTNKKRPAFYYSHMHAGVVLLVFIMLMSLSGASITFREATQRLFGMHEETSSSQSTGKDLKGEKVQGSTRKTLAAQENSIQSQISVHSSEEQWLAWLSIATAAVPDAQLLRVQFPRTRPGAKSKGKSNALSFRFLAKGDWLALPSSSVVIDRQTSTLDSISLFKNLPMPEKIYAQLKPLHTGKGLPVVYVVFQLLMSVLGVVMVYSGLHSFIVKKRSAFKFNLNKLRQA